MVEKISGVEVVAAAASSKLALTWLTEGKVHIAGSHLEDPKTGEFNLPFIRKEFPDEDFSVITFARWEEGLVLQIGNPKSIRKVEDLALQDGQVRESRTGFRQPAHFWTSSSIRQAWGSATSRVTIASPTDTWPQPTACSPKRPTRVPSPPVPRRRRSGLISSPLHSERYGDLVMRRRTADLPAVKGFLDVLQRAQLLRRKLEVLAGYDTSGNRSDVVA